MRRWFSGRYLGLEFVVDGAEGLSPGVLLDYLQAHCLASTGATPALRIVVGPDRPSAVAHAGPPIQDRGGSAILATPTLRWHRVVADRCAFSVVQDIYCGLRRVALARASAVRLVHAACVAFDGVSVMIVGAKGSGKSFTALASLLDGAAHLATDKTCVWRAADGVWRCAGLIGSARVRRSDLARYPSTPALDALARRAQAVDADPDRRVADKVNLTPVELCRALDVEPLTHCVLGALVVLDAPAGRVAATRLSEDAVSEILARHALTDHGALERPTLPSDPAAMQIIARQLVGYRLEGRPSASALASRIQSCANTAALVRLSSTL